MDSADRTYRDKVFKELKTLKEKNILSKEAYIFFLECDAVDFNNSSFSRVPKALQFSKFNLN
tara:strand:+ start:863 stop:1048 length:186 start_codon:yes stop_codon:yes gene_type:complete